MSKLEENVNAILGIEKENIKVEDFNPPEVKKDNLPVTDKTHVDAEYGTSRENYYSLIDKGQKAIDGILDIAKEGQHPRAYEVAGQLIGQVAQVTDKLQDLQKKLKDLKELPKSASPQIKNALFVGSTNELQKMLRKESPETSAEKAQENEIIDGESSKSKKDKD